MLCLEEIITNVPNHRERWVLPSKHTDDVDAFLATRKRV